VNRRKLITLLGAAAAWPLAARAQQPAKLPLVGVLVSASPPHPFADALRRGLHTLGYSEGRNIALGATTITGALTAKRLELLRAAVGGKAAMAILINPSNPLGLAERSGAEAAARDTNQTLEIVTARNESEIVATFASLNERRFGALIIGSDSFYLGQMRWMAALAAHNRVPAIGPLQEFTAADGLMNYGPSIADGVRQAGVYVGKVLKGARPADLPVVQPTKFELAINLKAAKALGIDVPQTLLVAADEVIE
jgi:putative tryptophan/tyrosine transport system substrate-binding protein